MEQGRLSAIEAFLQREDDELLYAPDGEPPGGAYTLEELEARMEDSIAAIAHTAARAGPAVVHTLGIAFAQAREAAAAFGDQLRQTPCDAQEHGAGGLLGVDPARAGSDRTVWTYIDRQHQEPTP